MPDFGRWEESRGIRNTVTSYPMALKRASGRTRRFVAAHTEIIGRASSCTLCSSSGCSSPGRHAECKPLPHRYLSQQIYVLGCVSGRIDLLQLDAPNGVVEATSTLSTRFELFRIEALEFAVVAAWSGSDMVRRPHTLCVTHVRVGSGAAAIPWL